MTIRPRRIHRTPQRFNITEQILPYNNVCNFKIKHTNSKFCRLCIIYKIPELIKDNYFPKIVLEKMYTHSYSGFTKYAKTYTNTSKEPVCPRVELILKIIIILLIIFLGFSKK